MRISHYWKCSRTPRMNRKGSKIIKTENKYMKKNNDRINEKHKVVISDKPADFQSTTLITFLPPILPPQRTYTSKNLSKSGENLNLR